MFYYLEFVKINLGHFETFSYLCPTLVLVPPPPAYRRSIIVIWE